MSDRQRPLRILYSFPHQLGRSGIGTTAWHQVAGLLEAGQKVTVFCGTIDRPLPGGVEVIETMRWASVRIPYRAIGVERAWRVHDWQAARLLRRRAHEFDVVHTWPSGALATLRAAKELGVASFLERANTHTGYAYDVVRRECERLGLTQVEGACHTTNPRRLHREEAEFRLADRLLCPSDFVAQTFIERGYPPGQIARHRYGCDLSRFKPTREEDDKVTRWQGDKATETSPPSPCHLVTPSPCHGAPLTAAFVGTCEPRKGLHFALKAWLDSPASKDGEFRICGKFVPGYRELLSGMLAHASVKEMGFQADVSKVMATAHVLVLPTLEEGSALVTYEARAAGCVLLVSDAAGAPAEHMTNALVHPAGDVAMLTQHLTLLAEDRELLRRLRCKSLEEEATLSWSFAARELAQRYRECLAARRAPAVDSHVKAPLALAAG